MYSDHHLRVLLGAGSLAIVCAILGGLSYMNRPMPPDGEPVLGTPQLVMFETDDCTWCEDFRRTVARDYQDTASEALAPLSFISIEDGPPPKRYRLGSFSKSPMLVMFDQYGRELDRIESAPKTSAAIETLVHRNMRRIAKS